MKEHIHIFDTTLRDGEQCPGAAMTVEQKIQVAMQLEALGVDVIEAGFPVISDGDFHAVRTVAERTENAPVMESFLWRKSRPAVYFPGAGTAHRRISRYLHGLPSEKQQ